MDLGKIIAQLRLELQCLDAVIVSMEALIRVQSLAETQEAQSLASEAQPEELPPSPKPRRGRPRKSDQIAGGISGPGGASESTGDVPPPEDPSDPAEED